MAEIRGQADPILVAIAEALGPYEHAHPKAEAVVYRQNSVSVRIRIIDPDLGGISREDRHDLVWDFLKTLPDEVQSEVSILLLLTPNETDLSYANLEFDHPVPSSL